MLGAFVGDASAQEGGVGEARVDDERVAAVVRSDGEPVGAAAPEREPALDGDPPAPDLLVTDGMGVAEESERCLDAELSALAE